MVGPSKTVVPPTEARPRRTSSATAGAPTQGPFPRRACPGDGGRWGEADRRTTPSSRRPLSPATLGGLAGADLICNTLADATRVSQGPSWRCCRRARWMRATVSLVARGWVRPDGRVVADTIEDLFDGSVYHPILLTEDGERIRDVLDDPDAETVTVFTGSRADGLRRSNEAAEFCRDWTDQDPSFAVTHYYGVAASTSEDLIRREFDVGIGCRSSRRLYCFGTDQNTTVEPRRLEESEGRYAFVYGDGINEPPFDGAGCRPEDLECPPGPERPVDVFDEACAAAARSAGLPGTYRALIGTSTTAPLSRFNSNVNALPWMRLDRVPLVESASDLRRTEGLVTTPTNSAGAQPVRDVWLGSTSPDSRSTDR
jgi:hypothetical protein